MKLTKKDIESDIKFIINELKTQDVEGNRSPAPA